MPTGFKWTHEEAEEIMLKAGLQPLEPYVNNTTKWKTKCLKCSQIIYPMFQSVKAGHGCRNCAYKNQIVNKDSKNQIGNKKKGGARPIKHEIAEAIMLKANLQPLEPYVINVHKWKCKCLKCGAIVYPRYTDIKRGTGGCRTCGNKKLSRLKTLSSEKTIEVMIKANLKPLEPYKGATKRWKCRCLVCNKIVYPSYSNVSKGSNGCVYCSKQEVDPIDVVKKMIKVNLKPLEPYTGNRTNWKCECMKCGRIVYPKYSNVSSGRGGCIYCMETGFDYKKPAVLYVISNEILNSIKVGITNTNYGDRRLSTFRLRGWEIQKKYEFSVGKEASEIEAKIFKWLRKDLNLPVHLTAKLMPKTGGHTETVSADSITVLEIQKKVEELIKGYRNNP
jgi:DNA-directed RNA polymerase subunit M/transcription elongation factor TFIIS